MSHERFTKIQQAILDYIQSRCEQSHPPSYRDIQEAFGYRSVNAVQGHVKALVKKNAIEKWNDGKQGAGLVPVGFRLQKFRKIPVYGEIVAGNPVEAPQVELGTVQLPENLLKGACFALRVKGDSMIGAGILEGDFVVARQKVPIKDGDIVVALLNGESTLKRYCRRGQQVWLIPENAKLKPIPVTGELQIQGKVIFVQRYLGN